MTEYSYLSTEFMWPVSARGVTTKSQTITNGTTKAGIILTIDISLYHTASIRTLETHDFMVVLLVSVAGDVSVVT